MAVWFYLSGHLIEKVGDLKCPYLYIVSPFWPCCSSTFPWLVLVVDIRKAAGYAFSYTGLNIYFSKHISKASAAVILDKKSRFFVLIKNSFIRYFIGKLPHVFPFCVLNLVEIFIDYIGN